jgi:hypothetical protein
VLASSLMCDGRLHGRLTVICIFSVLRIFYVLSSTDTVCNIFLSWSPSMQNCRCIREIWCLYDASMVLLIRQGSVSQLYVVLASAPDTEIPTKLRGGRRDLPRCKAPPTSDRGRAPHRLAPIDRPAGALLPRGLGCHVCWRGAEYIHCEPIAE